MGNQIVYYFFCVLIFVLPVHQNITGIFPMEPTGQLRREEKNLPPSFKNLELRSLLLMLLND